MRPFDMLCGLISVAIGHRTADSDLAAAVAAADVPWPRLVTLSGVHLLTPALAPALRDEKLREAVPPDLVDYLSAMHAAATQRNAALRCQLEQVAAQLNGIGIVPVALKGAIRLIDGLWPDPALRFMHDLDLLVPETSLAPCVATLAGLGWRQMPAGAKEAEHHLALSHPEAAVRIELHHQPLAAPHTTLLPATRMLARATPARLGQASVAIPALEDQLVHLVAHAMLQHAFLENGRFLLRDLVEQKLLMRRSSSGELRAAQRRFSLAGQSLAWELSAELLALCLDGETSNVSGVGRLLAGRMMLQQRSPLAMRLLAPAGWIVARLIGPATAPAAPKGLADLATRAAVFRAKTRW